MADDRRTANGETPDEVRGLYRRAGNVRWSPPRDGRRWFFGSGDEDGDSVTLYVRTFPDGDANGELVCDWEIYLPLRVEGDELILGAVKVRPR